MCVCVCVWKEPVPVPNRPCALPLQFEELQVSKFLVSMEASGLPFTLLLNKADLVPEQEVQRRLQQVWRGQGYEGHKQRTYSFSLSVTPTIR